MDFATVESVTYTAPSGNRRLVECVVSFPASFEYEEDGVFLEPGDFGLSAITEIEEAQADGWVLRGDFDQHPPVLRLYGVDTDTFQESEAEAGTNLDDLSNARLRVWGW